MRIHQLPMGARFEYEGKEYEKIGPMLASSAGATRLIPKYAELRAIGEYGLVPATEAAALQAAREDFLQALAR